MILQVPSAALDLTAHDAAAACPDLSNAPTHGPDEPLLLQHDPEDGRLGHLNLVMSSSIPPFQYLPVPVQAEAICMLTLHEHAYALCST